MLVVLASDCWSNWMKGEAGKSRQLSAAGAGGGRPVWGCWGERAPHLAVQSPSPRVEDWRLGSEFCGPESSGERGRKPGDPGQTCRSPALSPSESLASAPTPSDNEVIQASRVERARQPRRRPFRNLGW